jgi:uncharacterized protein (DUF1800 family)
MAQISQQRNVRGDIALLHRRAGFGASPDELDRLAAGGYDAAVERVLSQLTATDAAADAVPLPAFTDFDQPDPTPDSAAKRQAQQARDQQRRREGAALVEWWLGRMLTTTTPLREKLTLFWHGHFATSIQKVKYPQLMHAQNELLRTSGAGGFEALAQAVAKDPAMLLWLDAATNSKAHPNENFARELMELFTLGIGNYSERDVTEAARCFTGWRLDRKDWTFAFAPKDHDDGPKTVLGQTGAFGGEDVVHLATRSGASARFIASKVWSHFARPGGPDDPVVAQLAAGYAKDLDVTALLRAVFLHPEFRSDATRAGLVKTPIEYVVGAVRALQLKPTQQIVQGMAAVLKSLGQVPFDPPSVGGWPQNGYWLTTASSLSRLGFAELIVRNADLSSVSRVTGTARVAAVARLLSLDAFTPATEGAFELVLDDPRSLVAVALVSPEYVLA